MTLKQVVAEFAIACLVEQAELDNDILTDEDIALFFSEMERNGSSGVVEITVDGLFLGTTEDIPNVLDEIFPGWKWDEDSHSGQEAYWSCDLVHKGSFHKVEVKSILA